MASTGPISDLLSDLLAKTSVHFSVARPLIPMYIHLIISALFPIYAGAHASLSRPSSAAKPDKAAKAEEQEDEDEDEEKIQKMEGMSNTDAIILPLTAGLVLTGLYFLIMWYGADVINLVLGWYFSFVGVYSVGKLVNDAANFCVSFLFPRWYASGGSLWKVMGQERKVIRQDGDNDAVKSLPMPFSILPSPQWMKDLIWSLRQQSRQKYTFKAYIQSMLDLHANLTIINVLSALAGVATIAYVNTVSKPWFLTNLQGFAVSYSALQLMSPTTFATGSLILGALFCYDIWAVFFTPLMVTVAKNLDQPIKLVFPRPDEPSPIPGEPPVRSFSMLGLGDIVLPGIMIGLALRFDLYMFYFRKQTCAHPAKLNGETTVVKTNEVKAAYVPVKGHWGDRFWTWNLPAFALPTQLKTSFPKPYFTASMVGYIVGMLTTLGVMSVFHHAQPALLYLVPGVLISLWGTALVRRELGEMWAFSEAVSGQQLVEDESKEGESSAKAHSEQKTVAKGLFERLWQEVWTGTGNQKKSGQGEKESKASSSSMEKNLSEARSEDPPAAKETRQHETQSKASSDPGEAEQNNDKKTKPSESSKERDGLVFSFSISRYNPASSGEVKTGQFSPELSIESRKTSSIDDSESSNDAVVVSPEDFDDSDQLDTMTHPRTRSQQATVADKR